MVWLIYHCDSCKRLLSPHWLMWVGRLVNGLLRVGRRIGRVTSWLLRVSRRIGRVTSWLLRVGRRIGGVTSSVIRVDSGIGRIALTCSWQRAHCDILLHAGCITFSACTLCSYIHSKPLQLSLSTLLEGLSIYSI